MTTAKAKAKALRAESNVLKVKHRMQFTTGPRKCSCGKKWPCTEWEKAEELLKKAHELENP